MGPPNPNGGWVGAWRLSINMQAWRKYWGAWELIAPAGLTPAGYIIKADHNAKTQEGPFRSFSIRGSQFRNGRDKAQLYGGRASRMNLPIFVTDGHLWRATRGIVVWSVVERLRFGSSCRRRIPESAKWRLWLQLLHPLVMSLNGS